MKDPYVFISFSSRDIPIVREIMAAIKLQGIDFWDYSNDYDNIKVGSYIPDALKKEIDKCDKMLVIISESSIHPTIGKYCRFELEYARQKGFEKNDQFIPVILPPLNLNSLPYPYDIFSKILCLEFSLAHYKMMVNSVQKICQRLNRVYIPPIEAHLNLPFWEMFRHEVEDMAHSNADHVSLMLILGEFLEFFKAGDFNKALFLISYFIQSAIYKIPHYPIFYPFIVKTICEIKLGKLTMAMDSLLEAEKVDPNNQDVIGAKGIVYFKTGEYKKARECFQKIMSLYPENHTNARINLLTTKISLNEKVSEKEKQFILNLDLQDYPEDLQSAIYGARLRLLFFSKSFEELKKLSREIIEKQMVDTNTIIYYYYSLFELGSKGEALLLLKEYLNKPDNEPRIVKFSLYNLLVDHYIKTGENKLAIQAYEDHILENKAIKRRHLIKYARILTITNKSKKAKSICEEILSGKSFGLPKSREDFYYDGFANYLLGLSERAEYDYKRSGKFDRYYDTLF